MTKIIDVIDYIVRKNNKCGLKSPDKLKKHQNIQSMIKGKWKGGGG